MQAKDNHDDPQECVSKGAGKYLIREDHAPKQISHLQFGLLSALDMQRLSEFQICSSLLFQMPQRTPAPGGCLDPRLGVSDKTSLCKTCKKNLVDCAGHYGYIKLAMPVFHIGYFKHILNFLQCICKSCSRVLMVDSERDMYLKRMRSYKTDALAKGGIFKKILDKCKKCKHCPHCHSLNGTVKRIAGVSTLKIIHDKYHMRHMEDELEELMMNVQSALSISNSSGKELNNAIKYANEDLVPTRVLDLFHGMTDEDCEVLWTNPLIGRPENLILQNLLVPPVPIRPSVATDGGSNEDDLTVKLQEIIDVNVALEIAIAKGTHSRTIAEEWDFLQVAVAQYINGEMPGLARPMGVKPIRGICQRLKGKQGRFRGNLSGKRVDFSARTVISPDPNLSVKQVGVPVHVAKTMTYPELVSRYNIEKLRVRVRNGPDIHPGANLIRMGGGNTNGGNSGGVSNTPGGGGFIKSLAFGDRDRAAEMLRIGDTVERHMEDGDIVLFNRQPSLHRLSIMSHEVKVMEWRTFRFNICVCAPYNADFDGDEMNMHLPQTEEARTEASMLMGVQNNLVTPRNGEPLVAASQDFLSASYMITQRNVFYNYEEFCSLISYFGDANEEIELPKPSIIKPIPLWTGKQLFSVMLRPNSNIQVYVNLEMKEKNYDNNLKYKHFCPNDGWVAFRNSELISGNIAKKTIGDGSKTGLLYVLLRDCGNEEACKAMDRFSKLCSRLFGGHKGFSIGIDDVTPSDTLLDLKKKILTEGYTKAKQNIGLYEEGSLDLRPGCDLLQSLEEILNGILGKLRESAGQEAMKALPWSNAPRIMASCGSKGSPLNISQMIACVGQQAVGGMRIQEGFVHRTLPHFEYHSLTPSAKGFVANSFYTGLSATEFFFHTMGGREGLVDTAVKTAETGYMARRLMKALEDLSLLYDSSVRNSENTVVQFVYGDDSLDPAQMENNDRPVDFQRVQMNIIQMLPCRNESIILKENELLTLIEQNLILPKFQDLLPRGVMFLDEIRTFFKQACNKLNQIILHVTQEFYNNNNNDDEDDEDEDNNKMNIDDKSTEEIQSILEQRVEQLAWSTCRFTKTQVEHILNEAYSKYTKAYVEPGEAIGATGAQSISEPGTQMTLKTFHFAGVSSMNVTLGVPRLKEIINASKDISTPIITAKLVRDDNKVGARMVKASIEKTTLGEIAEYIKEVYAPGKCYVSVKLDMNAIEQLKLGVDAYTVRNSIVRGVPGQQKPKVMRDIKEFHVKIRKNTKYKLRIYIPDKPTSSTNQSVYFTMQGLKVTLPQVIVQGIPSVNRAVINEEQNKNGQTSYHLLVEGYGLAEVMGSPGVDGRQTTTNHIIEVEQTLGVEAARVQISNEISYIMNAYGIGIDSRHLLLLSDVMTFKGEVLGITRFGVSKMRESVLMLASFEKTTDHLFDAAVHGRTDAIVGVSECIIMGIPIPLGTGLFKLLNRANMPLKKKEKEKKKKKKQRTGKNDDYDYDDGLSSALASGLLLGGEKKVF